MATFSDLTTDVATGGVIGVPSTRIPFGASDTTLTTDAALTWDNAARTLDIAASKSGATVSTKTRNTSNTASSKALHLIEVAGGTADDAVLQWSVSGVTTVTAGIDNSDSDSFKVEFAATLGGATPSLVLTTAGRMGVGLAAPSTQTLAHFDLNVSGNTALAVTNGNAGTAALSGFFASVNASSPLSNDYIAAYIHGAGFTGTPREAWIEHAPVGNAPLHINVLRNGAGADLILETNSVETCRVLNAGGFQMAKRHLQKKGADVASANTMTLGTDGNSFHITGTTTINGITTASWQSGSILVLRFAASLTVTHNSGAPGGGAVALLLAGAVNFSATANDTLTLWYDGTNFVELARAVI